MKITGVNVRIIDTAWGDIECAGTNGQKTSRGFDCDKGAGFVGQAKNQYH